MEKTYPQWNFIFLIDNPIRFDGSAKGSSAKFGENTTKFVAAFINEFEKNNLFGSSDFKINF